MARGRCALASSGGGDSPVRTIKWRILSIPPRLMQQFVEGIRNTCGLSLQHGAPALGAAISLTGRPTRWSSLLTAADRRA